MTMQKYWTEYWQNHALEDMPWHINRPDHNLVSWFLTQAIKPKTVLDIGCGNGDNAVWLAQQGLQVSACDITDLAIDHAKKNCDHANVEIVFHVTNAIEKLPPGPYDLVFDRGLFHQFNIDHDRALVAKNISEVLTSNGTWVSVIGSTECCQHRLLTPLRRSVHDIAAAVEPYLRIEKIQASTEEMITENGLEHCSAWFMVAKKREVPPRPWVPKSKV